uniref:Uncharacterized protein n=1 Tax=Cyprinus carpio TaxID=7962 RepID=A0A8C1KAA0_CYPCA
VPVLDGMLHSVRDFGFRFFASWHLNEKFTQKCQGGQAHAYTVDVTNREQVYRTANQVRKEVGRLNVMLNVSKAVKHFFLV